MKVVCVGLNYVDHAREVELALPERPLLFAKWQSAVIASGEPVVIPAGVEQVDYEAELAAVIGTRVKGVSAENALEAVAGYTCLNDVSARVLQFADGQWTRAKSLDTFCPIGPHVVPREEVGDPQALRIQCRVNGETVQDGSTADMIFGVAELVAYVSATITLEPGDVIATGTPPGVAFGRPDGRYLQDGDTVEVEIERIGVLVNPVVAG
ncbi:MAG TPA: fumarylacetoacetate hydrolase family protein [Gaiellaceae bacterium]|jgi:5-carboxymethyl-2-hydroxymuconate isomerase|nr:fumarylacetoacetate hydrolase family protein [Gaiellaceae bacterium]